MPIGGLNSSGSKTNRRRRIKVSNLEASGHAVSAPKNKLRQFRHFFFFIYLCAYLFIYLFIYLFKQITLWWKKTPNGRWLQRAHELERDPSKWHWEISMWGLKTFFIGDHLISTGKNVRILVKTFFFGDHIIIRTKLQHFFRLFWSSLIRKSVIFGLAPGACSALVAPEWRCLLLKPFVKLLTAGAPVKLWSLSVGSHPMLTGWVRHLV